MRKIAGIVLAMMVAGVLLSGCYNKTCEQPMPVAYKGDR